MAQNCLFKFTCGYHEGGKFREFGFFILRVRTLKETHVFVFFLERVTAMSKIPRLYNPFFVVLKSKIYLKKTLIIVPKFARLCVYIKKKHSNFWEFPTPENKRKFRSMGFFRTDMSLPVLKILLPFYEFLTSMKSGIRGGQCTVGLMTQACHQFIICLPPIELNIIQYASLGRLCSVEEKRKSEIVILQTKLPVGIRPFRA